MNTINMIAALGMETRVIGRNNDVVWKIPEDVKRFKTLTKGHPVIMGRKTWDSLPEKFRPLPGRANIVVTQNPEWHARGAIHAGSLDVAIEVAKESPGADEIFIIGGGELYTIGLPYTDRLYMTFVHSGDWGDVYFPLYAHLFRKVVHEEEHLDHEPSFTFQTLERA